MILLLAVAALVLGHPAVALLCIVVYLLKDGD